MRKLRLRPTLGCLMLLCLAGEASGADGAVRSILDARTGTTVQVTIKPWTLALEQPQLAAHARDYIALHAVQVSNGGMRRHFLAAFFWSTVPGRNRHAGDAPALRLLIDDRDVRLSVPVRLLLDTGLSSWPLRLPGRDALLVMYAVDAQLLRQLGYATSLRIRPGIESSLPAQVWFESWRDARPAFRSFAAQVAVP
jgi:hypothetical protein